MNSEQTRMPRSSSDNANQAARLFADYEQFIRATIVYFIRDEQEREDIFQNLFIYFVRKPVPDDVVYVKRWLYKVILDRIRDFKRCQGREAQHMQAYAQTLPDGEYPKRPAVDPERMEALFAAIRNHLTDQEAQAMLYKYKHHLDNSEIARQMNINPRTVSHYLAVGISKLKALLNKDGR